MGAVGTAGGAGANGAAGSVGIPPPVAGRASTARRMLTCGASGSAGSARQQERLGLHVVVRVAEGGAQILKLDEMDRYERPVRAWLT